MTQVLHPGTVSGSVKIPASKSVAHRMLICAALSDSPSVIFCGGLSKDILATIRCLNALGAKITVEGEKLSVTPISAPPHSAILPVGESGSTLRFLLPLVGALGINAEFQMEGRLPDRPLFPLDRELTAHGMRLQKNGASLLVSGQLSAGDFSLPGNVSSQYLSGLAFALPLLQDSSTLTVTLPIESEDYFSMTTGCLKNALVAPLFAQKINELSTKKFVFSGRNSYHFPESAIVEGDWSNAAFFLCMGALSDSSITVRGLSAASSQGDKRILDILVAIGAEIKSLPDGIFVKKGRLQAFSLDAAPVPDLVPVLAALAAVCDGKTKIYNAARLRLKESDRLLSTANLIKNLGGTAEILPDGLEITGKPSLSGGAADCCNDHRIAMSAAVLSIACRGDVTVSGSECVEKSYPDFFSHFSALKGGSL